MRTVEMFALVSILRLAFALWLLFDDRRMKARPISPRGMPSYDEQGELYAHLAQEWK